MRLRGHLFPQSQGTTAGRAKRACDVSCFGSIGAPVIVMTPTSSPQTCVARPPWLLATRFRAFGPPRLNAPACRGKCASSFEPRVLLPPISIRRRAVMAHGLDHCRRATRQPSDGRTFDQRAAPHACKAKNGRIRGEGEGEKDTEGWRGRAA